MRRRRDLPDAKIVPFPDNHRGDDSPSAHRATWGPNHDAPPMTAGEVVLVNRRKLIAVFTLHLVLRPGLGFYLRGCRLIQWGAGQRVFLPQRSTNVKEIAASDDDGKFTVIRDRTYYSELLTFDTNRGAKAFEEAALRAARYAVDRHRSEQPERSAAFVDGGTDTNHVPF